MKRRSGKVTVSLIGATAFVLAGCGEEQQSRVDAQAFPDLQSCLQTAGSDGSFLSVADCETAVSQAQELHVEAAPRYASIEVCETEHGAGACGSEAQASEGGSGSIFMPLLAGYLIGNMMSGRGGMAAAQPMYRTSDGRFTNAARSSTFSGNSGRGQMSTSQFNRPPTTMGRPPMSQARSASKGGFGRSGGMRRSSGG